MDHIPASALTSTGSRRTCRLRIRQWCRAVGGVALIAFGVLLSGALVGMFSTSSYLITVGLVGGIDHADAVARFSEQLRRQWPGEEFTLEVANGVPDGFSTCPVDAGAIQVSVSATRRSFSNAFRQVQHLARDSGLWTCGTAYSRTDPLLVSLERTLGFGVVPTAMVLGVLLLRWQSGRGSRPWSASAYTAGRALGLGLGMGVALICFMTLFGLAAQVLGLAIPGRPTPPSTDPAALAVWLLAAVVLTPLVEEFAFRAWFLSQATAAVGAPLAVLASSLAFSAVHFPEPPIQAAAYFAFSVAMSVLWYRSGSLLACVAAHGSYNALVLIAVLAIATT